MKAKIRQHKTHAPVPIKLTEQQRANAKEWHAQKLAESFGEFEHAMIRCWKILGSVTMTLEAMRIHATQLQTFSKDGRRKCRR